MKEKHKVELGFYRLNRAIKVSVNEKQGKNEETHLEKGKKCFGIRHLACHYDWQMIAVWTTTEWSTRGQASTTESVHLMTGPLSSNTRVSKILGGKIEKVFLPTIFSKFKIFPPRQGQNFFRLGLGLAHGSRAVHIPELMHTSEVWSILQKHMNFHSPSNKEIGG